MNAFYAFFDIVEIQSWLADLSRMEAHIPDGPHLLLKTHAVKAVALLQTFLEDAAAVS